MSEDPILYEAQSENPPGYKLVVRTRPSTGAAGRAIGFEMVDTYLYAPSAEAMAKRVRMIEGDPSQLQEDGSMLVDSRAGMFDGFEFEFPQVMAAVKDQLEVHFPEDTTSKVIGALQKHYAARQSPESESDPRRRGQGGGRGGR